jgi:hypothetical protein
MRRWPRADWCIDPAPEGKDRRLHPRRKPGRVPAQRWRLLEWFNHFHRTTREHHVRRESLLLPGMAYDPALVDETMRNLRNRTTYRRQRSALVEHRGHGARSSGRAGHRRCS